MSERFEVFVLTKEERDAIAEALPLTGLAALMHASEVVELRVPVPEDPLNTRDKRSLATRIIRCRKAA
jgi:hypothetical protein